MASRDDIERIPDQDIEFVARHLCKLREIDPEKIVIVGQLQRHVDPDFLYGPSDYQTHPAWHVFWRAAAEAIVAVGELTKQKVKTYG